MEQTTAEVLLEQANSRLLYVRRAGGFADLVDLKGNTMRLSDSGSISLYGPDAKGIWLLLALKVGPRWRRP